MFGIGEIKIDIKGLRQSVDNVFSLFRNINDKVNHLYMADHHGTTRLKVDMLSDDCGRSAEKIWIKMGELQRRIEELEQNAVKK